jgi:hypothetical protein
MDLVPRKLDLMENKLDLSVNSLQKKINKDKILNHFIRQKLLPSTRTKPPTFLCGLFNNEKYYLFLFEYATMFVKVQTYLRCSKIRPKIAPNLNGV